MLKNGICLIRIVIAETPVNLDIVAIKHGISLHANTNNVQVSFIFFRDTHSLSDKTYKRRN